MSFMERIEYARLLADVPFVVNSGFRCDKHNREVGGSEGSPHTRGLAMDIRVHGSRDRFLILKALVLMDFVRIGIGKNFIHADLDRERDQKVAWMYE
jgi:uncharacterized protein YcbK (DUF882 family)